MDVRLTGEAWAWGRNGEIRRPAFVTVQDMPGDEPTIWLSVYASQRTRENGQSPIDLHLSRVDALAVAEAIREAAGWKLDEGGWPDLAACEPCGRNPGLEGPPVGESCHALIPPAPSTEAAMAAMAGR